MDIKQLCEAYGLATPTSKFWSALLAVKKDLSPVQKNARNPAFGAKSKYADLNSVLDEVTESCHKHDMDVSQVTLAKDATNLTSIATLIVHAPTGEGIAFVTQLQLVEINPQKEGGAITYCRRYALNAAFGLRTEDDDANSISEAPRPAFSPAPPQPQARPVVGSHALPGVNNPTPSTVNRVQVPQVIPLKPR